MNDPHENATWIYNYDRGGNILSKVKYAYTTDAVGTAVETIPYVYGDSNWKDKLTSYNGQTITYDSIGNPLNDGKWTYTWQAGRQLKQMNAEGTSISFKYDHNGMRVQKVVQQFWHPETTNYIYHGKTLTHMTVDYTDFDEVAHQDEMHFFYDAQSRPVKVKFNGTMYTYLSNLQGDIVGILDNAGTLVVEYKYDAWGKPLNTTGTLAGTLGKRNPFRYRGYVYDEESALYYVRSRFYNPIVGRFVNADDTRYVCEGMFINNLFAYCANSPVVHSDQGGDLFGISISFAIVDVVAAVGKAVLHAACTAIVSTPIVPIALAAVALVVVADRVIHTVNEYKRIKALDTPKDSVAITATTTTDDLKRDELHERPQYWVATVTQTSVLAGRPLTYSEAVSLAYSGHDIVAANRGGALAIARTHRVYVGYEKHGSRKGGYYLPHYHLCRSNSCAHIFFMH